MKKRKFFSVLGIIFTLGQIGISIYYMFFELGFHDNARLSYTDYDAAFGGEYYTYQYKATVSAYQAPATNSNSTNTWQCPKCGKTNLNSVRMCGDCGYNK